MNCGICQAGELRDVRERRNAYCAHCHALERHRALARMFAADLLNGRGLHSLEVGPISEIVFGSFLRSRGWDYVSIDQSAQGNPHDRRDVSFVDMQLDLTDLRPFEDDRFELMIIQHVIEEITDYERALDEVARVTAPGGVALLEIPHDESRERSERQPPDGFGNVWRFGSDLIDQLERRFGAVERIEFEEMDFRGSIFRCRAPVAASPQEAQEAQEPQEPHNSYGDKVARAWSDRSDPGIRSFWQSPVVMSEINRRITGDPAVDPLEHFRDRFCRPSKRSALSLGSGGGQLERRLVEIEACERILGVDISPERVTAATAALPAELGGRVEFQVQNLEEWRPQAAFDLIVAQDVLHHVEDLEGWCATFAQALEPGGLVYVHEFIGAARFQWTDAQLEIINRLLDRLPERLRVDLVESDGTLRQPVCRPDLAAFIESDPSEAISPGAIPARLERHLEPVIVKPYGGAIYHQLFNRIMGNFEDDEELVRILMELDFLLTDTGVVGPDYLWGVYTRPP